MRWAGSQHRFPFSQGIVTWREQQLARVLMKDAPFSRERNLGLSKFNTLFKSHDTREEMAEECAESLNEK